MGKGLGITAFVISILSIFSHLFGIFEALSIVWLALILTTIAVLAGDKIFSIATLVICFMNVVFLSPLLSDSFFLMAGTIILFLVPIVGLIVSAVRAPVHFKVSTVGASIPFKDFLLFRRMITPLIIQFIFWVGVIVCVIAGFIMIGSGASGSRYDEYYGKSSGSEFLIGILLIFVGPLVIRLFCESLILFFRMNETLTEIKNTIQKQSQ